MSERPLVAVLDYGIGNLRSAEKSLQRVGADARLTTDAEILAPMEERGKQPLAGLVVEVDEVYMHCAKALIRSDFWNPDKHADRKSFPSLGEIFQDHIPGTNVADTEEHLKDDYTNNLY